MVNECEDITKSVGLYNRSKGCIRGVNQVTIEI